MSKIMSHTDTYVVHDIKEFPSKMLTLPRSLRVLCGLKPMLSFSFHQRSGGVLVAPRIGTMQTKGLCETAERLFLLSEHVLAFSFYANYKSSGRRFSFALDYNGNGFSDKGNTQLTVFGSTDQMNEMFTMKHAIATALNMERPKTFSIAPFPSLTK